MYADIIRRSTPRCIAYAPRPENIASKVAPTAKEAATEEARHVVEEFLAFIGASRLVIHNAEFDVRFVNAELARLGREPVGMDRVVDTLALARRKHPGQPNSLDALSDRYRIDRSRRVRHGALLDAEILVDIYCELTGGRQRTLAFGDAEGSASQPAVPLSQRREARPWRRSPIESGEANAHADYIQSLGLDAIWFRYRARPA